MQRIKELAYRFRYEIFAALGACIVLWQMLLPGYVIVLDMVFGPHMSPPLFVGLDAAGFPFAYVIYLLHFVLSGWVIEKVILFALFFLLFYLPFRFYQFSNTYGEAYFVSVLYAVNPFVYERFLAGQWKVLAAYAFLFPFISLLIRFYRELSWRSALEATIWLLLMGMFSLHFLVMGAIIMGLYALAAAVRMSTAREWQILKTFLWRLCVSIALLCALSSYWIIPALTTKTTVISTFTGADLEAFKTAGDTHIGTLGNVAALYGFWGEHEVWSAYHSSPKERLWLWGASGAALAILIALGVAVGLRNPRTRFSVLLVASVGIVALVFSTGLGQSVFLPFNTWLFAHIWFWRGFRDTEKWSGVLALAYALLGGLGLGYFVHNLAGYKKLVRLVVLSVCILPLLYTPNMLFGFNNQLRPVEYPSTWQEANNTLKQDASCKAIFLPWHEYYTAIFNNRVLAANTAPAYFDCNIVSPANAEIGDVGDGIKASDATYQAIDQAITSNTEAPDATVKLLASYGVRYIIFTPDEKYDDPYQYPFLTSSKLHKVIDSPSLALYSVVW